MRIAVVTETFPPEINGVALTVASFVAELEKQGHAVVLTRPAQRATDPLARAAAAETFVRGIALPKYPGLQFGLPAARHLAALWRRERVDAVYVATEGPLGGSAVRAARRVGIPVATGFHTRFDDFVKHYGHAWLTKAVFAFLRRFHDRADATLVPTAELRDELARAGFANVRLLARGVDVARFDPAKRDPALRAAWGVDERTLAVLYVGRIAPEKNLPLVVRAFEAIAATRPAKLVWIGDGPARAALQRARSDDVFVGVKREDELARHFASGDLFPFASTTETFGNVTLEALASGVPVVAYDYGAARARIRDGANGRVVPTGDERRFVATSVALACDDEGRARIATRARESVLDLAPASVARELAELLEDLVARRAPQPSEATS